MKKKLNKHIMMLAVMSIFGLFRMNVVTAQIAQRSLLPQMDQLVKPGSSSEWIDFRDEVGVNPSSVFVDYSTFFGLRSVDEMRLKNVQPDELGYTHYRYQQFSHGYRVEAGEFIVHVNNANHVYAANGKMVLDLQLKQRPSITDSQSSVLAMQAMGAKTYCHESDFWQNELRERTGNVDTTYAPSPELVWYNGPEMKNWNPEAFRLTWTMDVYAASPHKSERFYIDAITGEVVYRVALESNCNATTVSTIFNGSRAINTQSFFTFPGFTYYMTDDCQTATWRVRDWGSTTSTASPFEYFNTTNLWSSTNQRFAGSINWEIGRCYNYFLSAHTRASYNNANGIIESYINAVFFDGVSDYVDNASMSFTGGTMKVGLGSSGTLANSWSCMDIIGHEYAHAVTGSSAALTYSYESGALNESFSDIFGEVIENYTFGSNDWLMGNERTNGAIRSVQNPNVYFNPDTYLGTYWYAGSGDAGGVHTNSGVQNYWFYLLTAGGSGTNDNGQPFSVSGIGLTNARAIAYRNLTVYLSSGSQYVDAREGAIRSAIDLFGSCSNEAIQTGKAWYACGVGNTLPVFDRIITCGSTNIGGLASGINSVVTSPGCSTGANPTFSDVVYRAGNFIDLKDGFLGQFSGSNTFTAMIDPCSFTSYRIPNPVSSDVEIKDNSATAESKVKAELNLNLWPNPCRDQCELSFVLEQEMQVSISMFDAQGKLIQQIQEPRNLVVGVYRFHLETANLPAGIYSIQIDMNGEKELLKMVKNE